MKKEVMDGNNMQCTNPTWRDLRRLKKLNKSFKDQYEYARTIKFKKEHTKGLIVPHYVLTPCGICMACRINKSTEWADRLSHELMYWDKASFVTITYDEENLPANASLEKSEIQKWLKRLRFHLTQKIQYYICGEYGDQSWRPHYHGIFFGINPKEMRYVGHSTWGKCRLANFTTNICIPETIKYTTKYLHKKLYAKSAEFYKQNNLEPPFALMSKGLGKRFAIENEETIRKNKSIMSDTGKPHPIPRYYRKILNIKEWELEPIDEEKVLKNEKQQEQRELNLLQKSKLKRGKL